MNRASLNALLERLHEQGFEPEISRGDPYNYDEPNFPLSGTSIPIVRKYTDGKIKNMNPNIGAGFSFTNPKEALLKSTWEAMERLCYYCYRKKDLISGKYLSSDKNLVDPSIFSKNASVKEKRLNWIKAINLLNGKKCYIPAQLVYFNYRFLKNEPKLDFPCNSNGGALGSTHEQALLNSMYELIERDAFMTTYLNKITPPRIDLAALNNKTIKMVLEKCARYKLELHLMDITNDIGIPSFLSILIDKTGMGPAICIGAKSGLKTKETILGAIEESFMVRFFIKSMLKKGIIFGNSIEKKHNVFADRAEYWFPREKLKEINFLISGRISKRGFSRFRKTKKEELDQILRILKNKKYDIYYTDIALVQFKEIGLFAYKVIVPKLQPLYLKESEKIGALNAIRLKEVAGFFGMKYEGANSIIHPFL